MKIRTTTTTKMKMMTMDKLTTTTTTKKIENEKQKTKHTVTLNRNDKKNQLDITVNGKVYYKINEKGIEKETCDDEEPTLAWIQHMIQQQEKHKATLKDYEACGEIGQGAFGSVKKMKRKTSGNIVADKIAILGTDHEYIAHRELKNLAILSMATPQTGLIQFEGVYYTNKKLHLMMTYMDGKSMEHHRVEEEEDMMQIAQDTIEGMNTMHAMGLLHRDIKPENILKDERNNRYAIGDYGFAIDLEKTAAKEEDVLSRSLQVEGTFSYMSRSRIEGIAATKACDRFALGLTLWIIAMGHTFPNYLKNGLFDRIHALKTLEAQNDPVEYLLEHSTNVHGRPFPFSDTMKQMINQLIKGKYVDTQRPTMDGMDALRQPQWTSLKEHVEMK